MALSGVQPPGNMDCGPSAAHVAPAITQTAVLCCVQHASSNRAHAPELLYTQVLISIVWVPILIRVHDVCDARLTCTSGATLCLAAAMVSANSRVSQPAHAVVQRRDPLPTAGILDCSRQGARFSCLPSHSGSLMSALRQALYRPAARTGSWRSCEQEPSSSLTLQAWDTGSAYSLIG